MALTFDEAVQEAVATEVRRAVNKLDNTHIRMQVCRLMGLDQGTNVNLLDVDIIETDGVITVTGIQQGDEEAHEIYLPQIFSAEPVEDDGGGEGGGD